MPDLSVILRAAGVNVREVGLWRAHVRPGSFAPVGNIVHHTADKGRGDSGLELLRVGRGQPNPLLGPLCNGSPREDGTLALLSAGRANHAGMGSGAVLDDVRADRRSSRPGPDTIVGNGLFYGWEVDNDGVGQPYPDAQIRTTVLVCAATSRHHGWSPYRTITHGRWSQRKADWSYCSTEQLQDLVADELRTPTVDLRPPPAKPQTGHPATVRLGDRGPVVKLLQQRLRANGHQLAADGVYGPDTLAAVRRHQRAWQLVVDGVVGPATWATLGR